jgi:hypothetical protein
MIEVKNNNSGSAKLPSSNSIEVRTGYDIYTMIRNAVAGDRDGFSDFKVLEKERDKYWVSETDYLDVLEREREAWLDHGNALIWKDKLLEENKALRAKCGELAEKIYLDHHVPHGISCRDCKDLIDLKTELLELSK